MRFEIPSVQIAQVLMHYSSCLEDMGTEGCVTSVPISSCFQFKADYPVQMDLTATQVLVRLEASGLNPYDVTRRKGQSTSVLEPNPPAVLGTDGAGVIVNMGELVDESLFDLGDKVFGRTSVVHTGTNCQYAVFDAMDLAHMPDEMTFEEAACIPTSALTAWQSIHCVDDAQERLRGANVVVVGGPDHVVSWAILLLSKMFQANVHVVCHNTQQNEEYLRTLGAIHVMDYESGQRDYALELTEKLGERCVRFAIDCMGGEHDSQRCCSLLTLDDGHYVSSSSNNTATVSSMLGFNYLWSKAISMISNNSPRCHSVRPVSSGKNLQLLVNWAEEEGEVYKIIRFSKFDLKDLDLAHMEYEKQGLRSHVALTIPKKIKENPSLALKENKERISRRDIARADL